MDIDDCIMAYSELMGSIFVKPKSAVDWKLQTRSRFESAKLRSAIEDIISNHNTSGSNKLNDQAERSCRV